MSWLDAIQATDEAILRAARGAPAWAVPVFYAFTVIGAGWGLFALAPFALRRGSRRATLWLLSTIVVTSSAVSLIKALVGRVRPCDVLGWCTPLMVASPGGDSFPSGHAAGSFAFAAFVSLHAPKIAWVALGYAAIVAWSRCVLGVHYPTDVLTGAALGSGIGFVSARIAMRRARAESTGHFAEGRPDPGAP